MKCKRSILGNLLGLLMLAAVAFAVWHLVSVPRTYAQSGYAQLWGDRSGSYFGAQAYITTPDPSIASGWSVAHTAVSELYSPRYIEAGAMKRASGSRHPYASWIDQNGALGFNERTDINLAANGSYKYKITYAGSGVWDAYIKTGSGWYFIATPRLYRYSTYPYVGEGGESSSFSNAIGPSTSSGNKYRSGSSWYSYCYDPNLVTNNCDGTISPCSNYSWSVSYSPED